MMTEIYSTVEVQGIHHWPQAATELPAVGFLQHPHMHTFRIRMYVPVFHSDRAVEFINLSHRMMAYLQSTYTRWRNLPNAPFDFGPASCEMIAKKMLHAFPQASKVEVAEDDFFGAVVTNSEAP